jgi:predicted Holliday junction resolvase-like endonuclease
VIVWIIVSVILFVIVIVLISRLSKVEREFEQRLKEERKEAIGRSRSVLGGKFTEQMAPYLPEFHYDPTEARFIGDPIDLVVFPGLASREPTEVVIIEVKGGKSSGLTPVERKIKELIDAYKVRFELIHRPSAEEELEAKE